MEATIREVGQEIIELVVAKNHKYGNSALEPLRVFSKASPVEQISVRVDDKLSRIANRGFHPESDEDTVQDLIGYLLLLLVHRRST